jgi:hypothetical protein
VSLLPKGEGQKEAARRLGAGIQGMLGDVAQRMHGEGDLPGRLSGMSNTFFKLTGLTFWTDAQAAGTARLLSSGMADAVGKPWAKLDRRHQISLRRFGIDEAEWAVLQKAKASEFDGTAHLMPEDVEGLDAELARKLQTYYTETVREAMTFAGVGEKRWTTGGGLSAGTLGGEAARFVMQFKQYPVTFMTKHLQRELKRGGSVDGSGLFALMAGLTVLGYASLVLKDLAAGKQPREPEDAAGWAKLVMAAMAQGGGAGLYGDFLFGQTNRFGGDITGSIVGPAVGKGVGLVAVLHAIRDGDDFGAKALRFGVGMVPGNNLIGARLVADYLFLHSLQEGLNPGYLHRLERRIARENDQQFWLPPTSALGQ